MIFCEEQPSGGQCSPAAADWAHSRQKSLKRVCGHARVAFNQHFEADGKIVYRQACALGCEGIVSKRLGSPYRAGRTDHWIKIKNPAAPTVKRGAEEEWRK